MIASFLSLLLLVGTAPAAMVSPAQTAVEIDVRARQIAPGEPLRIVVRASTAAARISGRFLGSDVAFSVLPGHDDKVWAGWTLVPLDGDPGMTVLEVHGEARDGSAIVGTRALTIVEKPFPEERLSVAPSYVEPPPEVARRLADERARLNRIYQTRRPTTVAEGGFVRPVPGRRTSVFGTRRVFNDQPRSPHPGVDLRAANGTPVASSGAGEVVLAEDLYYSGNTVIVDHGDGLFTLYAHLSSIEVEVGDVVSAGDTLGLSGATGRVTGPHLHWGAKIGSVPFDPAALLDDRLW